MIHNELHDIGIVVLLRSDKVLMEIIMRSRDRKRSEAARMDSLRDFYPSRFRKDSIEMIEKETAGMESLDTVFRTYFENGRDGSRIYADVDELERYSALINKIHPFNIIGYRMAKDLAGNRLDLAALDEIAREISPLALASHRNDRRYSDNHLHLGGANESLPNLLPLFEIPTPEKLYERETHTNRLPRLTEFSLINSGKLSLGTLIDLGKVAMEAISYAVLTDFSDREEAVRVFTTLRQIVEFGRTAAVLRTSKMTMGTLQHLHTFPETAEGRILQRAVRAAGSGKRTQQWFYYNVLLHMIDRRFRASGFYGDLVRIVFHTTNILRSYQVMSQNVGLSHFSEFYGSAIRQTKRERYATIAENILANGTRTFEGKLSPRAVCTGEMMRYKQAFDEWIDRLEPRLHGRDIPAVHTRYGYHFCLHFQRKKEVRATASINVLPARFARERKHLKKEAKKLHRYLYETVTLRTQYDADRHTGGFETFRNRRRLQERYIDPALLVTGLDVAGRELLTPPEVYAPAINYLRAEPKKKYFGAYENGLVVRGPGGHRRLRLSVHAGEDFNHIVTGMRRVDETIRYYDMRAHDRLGHALAVGIDVRKWLERNGDIYLSQLDLLDDLVWLQRQAEKAASGFPAALAISKKYERWIVELGREIYGVPVTPHNLYAAWKLRRYCPVETSSYRKSLHDPYIETAVVPEDKRTGARESSGSGALKPYELYHRYHYDAEVREKGEKAVIIRYESLATGRAAHRDPWQRITDEDLELYAAIQDLMIQKIADRGIIIEANPSSNVYIAQLDGFDEHPVFRWHPVEGLERESELYNRYGLRKGNVKVCVNTDDPAIFVTTLYSEFKQLKSAALRKGYHRPAVEAWLGEIRELGNEIFDYDHRAFEFKRRERQR